jgi:hypothetical protein
MKGIAEWEMKRRHRGTAGGIEGRDEGIVKDSLKRDLNKWL